MHKHANRISQRTKKCACSYNTHLALHLLFWISLTVSSPPFFFSFLFSLSLSFFKISPSMQQTSAGIQMVALAPQNLVERRLTVLLHQLYLDLCEVSLLVPLLSILDKCRFRWQWDAIFNCPILLSSVLINLNMAANISPLLRRGALHCPNWVRTLLSG